MKRRANVRARVALGTVKSAILLLAVSCAHPIASTPPPATPSSGVAISDTPAGRALRDWLEAFNSGEERRIKEFLDTYKPRGESAADMLAFRKQTGGFDLLGIGRSEPRRIGFRIQEKGGPAEVIGRIELTDAGEIARTTLWAVPPGTTGELAVKVDAAMRSRIIDGIVARLGEHYVFPEIAANMERALRARQQKGEYDQIDDGENFAQLLTGHLREISHDKHLHVECVPTALPKDEPEQEDPPIDPQMRAQLERMNCGFEKAERLDGKIGYVKFNMFGPSEVCGPKATAAMEALGDAGALIFDLRDNGGGDPTMVAFVSSYLFDKRTHLNDIWERKGGKTTEYWTRDVPGRKFPDAPVFVLVSDRTFSGAEEFAYNLKNLKRATIVGETTRAGAHPTDGFRLDDHFLIGVPCARAINPITRTNWEGTGVEPDVKVPAAEALDAARRLATTAISSRGTSRSK